MDRALDRPGRRPRRRRPRECGERARRARRTAMEAYRTQVEPLAHTSGRCCPRPWSHGRTSAWCVDDLARLRRDVPGRPRPVAGRDLVVRAPQAGRAARRPARERYRRAWEPGCGPGLVSRRLADRVGELVATDVSDDRGRAGPASRTRDLPGVSVRRSALPEVPFDGPVDLARRRGVPLLRPRPAGGAGRALVARASPAPTWSSCTGRTTPTTRSAAGPEMHARIRLDCLAARRPYAGQPRRPGLPARRLRGARVSRGRPADAGRRGPVATEAMRDAVRRLAAGTPRCGPDRSRTSPTRSPRSAASTCAWRGWSRGTPTRCGSSTRPGPPRDPACTASGPPARPAPACAPPGAGTGWRLDGELRFASGIDVVDRALLPGWVDADTHLLFDVPADAVEPDRATLAHQRRWTPPGRSR